MFLLLKHFLKFSSYGESMQLSTSDVKVTINEWNFLKFSFKVEISSLSKSSNIKILKT